jgi:ubiquinone/menaquinone biosynthesis C-methylase UbiE
VGFYSRHIFPFILDLTMDRKDIAARRRELLRDVGGRVLEIGIGSGLNLPCYPPSVKDITAVDINPAMGKRASKRMKASGVRVDLKILNGERLPFESGSFDSVVVTFTLCSIADVKAALKEMRRVLKKGGRLYFLEHGLCPEKKIARWQRRLNPIQKRIGDGCQLDRNIPALVTRTPFKMNHCRSYHLKGIPKTHGYFFQGVARKT